MKQNITIDQLNELSREGKEKLKQWLIKDDYGKNLYCNCSYIYDKNWPLRPLSIGQMIEFLIEKVNYKPFHGGIGETYIDIHFKKNKLCNVLWEAVKEVLEK